MSGTASPHSSYSNYSSQMASDDEQPTRTYVPREGGGCIAPPMELSESESDSEAARGISSTFDARRRCSTDSELENRHAPAPNVKEELASDAAELDDPDADRQIIREFRRKLGKNQMLAYGDTHAEHKPKKRRRLVLRANIGPRELASAEQFLREVQDEMATLAHTVIMASCVPSYAFALNL